MNNSITVYKNKKIGIVGDLHFGVNKDSIYRLKESEKCIDWIIKTFQEQNVDYIIFCGDLFDSRFSINVQTLNSVIKCIQNLSFNFEHLFLIVGNHDTYYKNVNTMNSINFLQKISETDNITIIEEKPFFIEFINKRLGLFPWGSIPAEILNNPDEEFEKCDYGFGHFETNGIEQNGSVSTCAKYNYHDLFKLANYVFSGHYHTHKIYSKKLNMVGSALQLDWGDFNRKKYIYTLDLNTDEIQKFENTVNSRFEKVYYSMLSEDKYTKQQLMDLCKNNFIKLVIDVKYQFNDVLKYTELIKNFNPNSLELEYLISLTSDIILESAEEIVKSNSKDNKEYLIEYIQKIYTDIQKVDESIELEYLIELIQSYYQKSLMTDSERCEKEL